LSCLSRHIQPQSLRRHINCLLIDRPLQLSNPISLLLITRKDRISFASSTHELSTPHKERPNKTTNPLALRISCQISTHRIEFFLSNQKETTAISFSSFSIHCHLTTTIIATTLSYALTAATFDWIFDDKQTKLSTWTFVFVPLSFTSVFLIPPLLSHPSTSRLLCYCSVLLCFECKA
jgi:hypothetical protein